MTRMKRIDPVLCAGLDPVRLHVPLIAVEELAPARQPSPPLEALIDEIDRVDRQRSKI